MRPSSSAGGRDEGARGSSGSRRARSTEVDSRGAARVRGVRRRRLQISRCFVSFLCLDVEGRRWCRRRAARSRRAASRSIRAPAARVAEVRPRVPARPRLPLAAGSGRRRPRRRPRPPAADAATVVDVASSSPVEDRTALLPRGHGLRVAGVPFYYTKNGPGTIRCGFTDSTERAAQARRFT